MITDDTSLAENLGTAGGPKWKTPDPDHDAIWGPGGLTERIRETWSEEEHRQRAGTMHGRPE